MPAAIKKVDEDRFDRQKRVDGWDQAAVGGTRALVAGAGALGNEVVKLLVQLGVGEIAVVDYDRIVAANLNRCVFFNDGHAKGGEYKAEALAREAAKLGPSKIIPVVGKLEDVGEGFFNAFTHAFGCLDNLGARLSLNAHCYGKMPLFDGGTAGFFGKAQVVAGGSSCIECGMSRQDYKLLWKKYSCVGELLDFLDPKMPALPTTTSLVAAVQVNEFIKLVHGREGLAGKYWSFNGLDGISRVFRVPKRKSCPVHP
ncbi:MAG: ThiF family adenylyltransferase [Candidatus Micrarchaeota archaeon]|nr:ThiF family adenylyltransferase [Candidatus Micrarchaeota archaeon]